MRSDEILAEKLHARLFQINLCANLFTLQMDQKKKISQIKIISEVVD